MYYAYKLNMQGDDIQPWCTPFPTSPLFIYKSNCCFLTCIQISQEAGKVGLVFSSLEEFSTVYCNPHKGFSVANEAEVNVFLEFSCFFYDPTDVGNFISGSSSAFSKSSLYIWKFLVHILLESSLKDFEHYFASMWNVCNCTVVWTFFGIILLWNCNKNWPFPVLWPLLSLPNLLTYWVQHFNSTIF